MSFAICLWVRDTALRLRQEGIDLQRKTLGNIATQMIPQKPTDENSSWEWDVNGEKENLEWLIK